MLQTMLVGKLIIMSIRLHGRLNFKSMSPHKHKRLFWFPVNIKIYLTPLFVSKHLFKANRQQKMTGRLSDDHMDQLESFIGTGPKTFRLLYSFTRDGCGNQPFHSKCDNQGPTVTVLYNPQGCVYGGYTSLA